MAYSLSPWVMNNGRTFAGTEPTTTSSNVVSAADRLFLMTKTTYDDSPVGSFTAKVLIVDDHPENLLALEAALEQVGKQFLIAGGPALEFVRATSGEDALRKVLDHEFALILLDVQMPGMDGYQTAEMIRKRPNSRYTPIIFLTAVSSSEVNVAKGYSLGAVDYLTKPFDPVILRAKVSVFIELYRKQVEVVLMAEELRSQAELLRSSNDELEKTNKMLGGLYRELETKSEALRLLNDELEVRVADRTKALEEANQALWKAKTVAEEANNSKDQFLAVLSHELRTPLTPVLAIVQMLEEDPNVSDDIRTWIETIGRNVQLEARLIDDLLDLTGIANGKLELHLQPTDLNETVRQTIGICEEDIRAKRLELKLDLRANHTTVLADPARIQQVLWNLVKNAVKFTSTDGTLKICSHNTDTGAVRVQVCDSGIGIPQEHLERVFNAFDQGDRTITRRYGGLGLGLAISKALVEQHHGRVWAESEGLDKGATFTLELEAIADAPQIAEEKKTPATDVGPNLSALRILLVEDNDDTSRAVQALLERRGFSVIVAHTVRSAIDIVKTYQCDLLISDIGLPDGDGIELLQKLNAIRPTHGIAMSGFGMDSDVRRSLSAGFDAHLVKPVDFNELLNAIRQCTAAGKFEE